MMNLSRPSSGSSSSKRFSSRIEQNEATRVLDDASRYENDDDKLCCSLFSVVFQENNKMTEFVIAVSLFSAK